ncbi:MAG: hypothetical protein HC905_16895 [Bacteroidales bacterium]|nr:hypothetical protein [Bacteroidales bacterium]
MLQCTDALSCVSILAAYGTNGLTTEHIQAINQLQNLQEIIFFFDGDNAGKEGVIKNTEKIQHIKCKITSIPTPDGEDVNSMFVTYGKDAILQLIEERQPVNNESAESRTSPSFSTELELIENENNAESIIKSGESFNPKKSWFRHFRYKPTKQDNLRNPNRPIHYKRLFTQNLRPHGGKPRCSAFRNRLKIPLPIGFV